MSRLLSTRVLVWVGLRSYSLYLWHHPVFVFYRIMEGNTLSAATYAWLIALSVLLSALSWYFVEQPFRNRRIIPSRLVWPAAATACVVLISFGALGQRTGGFPNRIQFPQSLAESFAFERSSYAGCFDIRHGHTAEPWHCKIGSGPAQFFALGDSHLLAVLSALRKAAEASGASGEWTGFSGCTPLLGAHSIRPDQAERNCHDLNARVYQHIKAAGIKKLLLVARWTYATDGYLDGGYVNLLGPEPDRPVSKDISRETFRKAFLETIDAYEKIGVTVVVIAQAPMQKQDAPDLYRKAYREFSDDPPALAKRILELSITEEEHHRWQSFVAATFAMRSSFELIDLTGMFCANGVCPVGTAEQSLYVDDDHLSVFGSQRLVKPLADALIGR